MPVRRKLLLRGYGRAMQIDDLRDTLAIEIAKIMLTNMLDDLESIEGTCKGMSCVYPLADAILSRRNVISTPIIKPDD